MPLLSETLLSVSRRGGRDKGGRNQERKSSLNINFLGGIFPGHQGPRRRTKTLCKWPFSQQFTYGDVSEGLFAESLRKVCGKFMEISRKVLFIASGKGAEILRKVCRNFAEICGTFSAMTLSRTTP